MGKYKHYKGNVGGGIDVSHKSKMSGKAKSLMSFPGGMPGPGEYGKVENKVVSKGMMKYLSGEPVGMGKYKDKGMPKYGDHMGPEKALVGKQKNLPEELKKKIEAAPGKYGKTKMDPKKSKKDTYREGGKKPVLTPAQKKKREENLKNRDLSSSSLRVPRKTPDKMKSKGPKKEERNADGTIMSPRQKRLAKEKEENKKIGEDFMKKYGKSSSKKSSDKKPMSDGEKIQASKAKKEAAGNKKKAEGQADLKKAKSQKFISRGSGEDSGIATREERRKAIRDARSKKREGRREARKARRKTVIKQKV
tara:strand:+ start:66 stop:983 length:918 start_codon:yes stop_codon:yes gene_type:complete